MAAKQLKINNNNVLVIAKLINIVRLQQKVVQLI